MYWLHPGEVRTQHRSCWIQLNCTETFSYALIASSWGQDTQYNTGTAEYSQTALKPFAMHQLHPNEVRTCSHIVLKPLTMHRLHPTDVRTHSHTVLKPLAMDWLHWTEVRTCSHTVLKPLAMHWLHPTELWQYQAKEEQEREEEAEEIKRTKEWMEKKKMNENLYIAHKKLPHKTLHVHSTRYTHTVHTFKFSQAKTTKGHSHQKVQTAKEEED